MLQQRSKGNAGSAQQRASVLLVRMMPPLPMKWSRHVPGSGLGLSLVAAILGLHGLQLAIRNFNTGFVVEIICTPGRG